MEVGNLTVLPVGTYQAGRMRVRFDVRLENLLTAARLVRSTAPAPPPGITGVVLFPWDVASIGGSGGVTIGGDGTEAGIDVPQGIEVLASEDWNGDGTPGSGAPHAFHAPADCGQQPQYCSRFEAFPELDAGTASPWRSVGFDVDPTVRTFRARFIVVADVQNSPP